MHISICGSNFFFLMHKKERKVNWILYLALQGLQEPSTNPDVRFSNIYVYKSNIEIFK